MPRNGFQLTVLIERDHGHPIRQFRQVCITYISFPSSVFFKKTPPHICKAFSNNKKKSTSFQMNATRFQVGKSKILILFVEIIKEHFGLYIYECRTPCKFDLDLAASVKKK